MGTGLASASYSPVWALPDAISAGRNALTLCFCPQEAQAFSIPSVSFNPSSPEPVRIPRSRLNQQFAVLLMRSVYDAVDELDFISMSDFQAKFWKLRQSLYEPYLLQYRPLQIKQARRSSRAPSQWLRRLLS